MTYSIVARCPDTGRMGIGIASQVLGVGRVMFGEAGVGVVATQGVVLTAHGPRILHALEGGTGAAAALAESLDADPEPALRQVAVVDTAGSVAVHTGEKSIAHAGHQEGAGWTAQSNVAADPGVWTEMGAAFEAHDGTLDQRLLAALEAGEAAGGDFRGQQSAAMLVVGASATGDLLADRIIDVRVDDHDEPLRELRRLVDLAVGAHELQRAEEALERGDEEEAERRSNTVLSAHPDYASYLFSYAIALAAAGRVDDARDLLRRATLADGDDRWRTLFRRLADCGILDEQAVESVLERVEGP